MFRWFAVALIFVFEHLLTAKDVSIKRSAWVTSPQYESQVETPALVNIQSSSKLECASKCMEAKRCDVIAYTKASNDCLGYASVQSTLETATRTELYLLDPSGSTTPTTQTFTTNTTTFMKRVCAGKNYTYVSHLNWCLQLVVSSWRDRSAAHGVCKDIGGRLASLDTFDKFTYVNVNYSSIYFSDRLWVGGLLTNGSWQFPNGEVLNPYQNHWHEVLEDHTGVIGSCLTYHSSVFYSTNCSSIYPFLCEEVW